MRALVFDRFGGAEVLHVAEIADPVVSPGYAIVRMHAIGVNFADVYRRRGNYHLAGEAPWVLGYEGAGVVEAIGEGVCEVRVGDRVGFADVARANGELVLAPIERLIPVPSTIALETASALLLQGLTAHYLVHDSHRLRPGETAVVHAAAGGVGLLLVQLAKLCGARVLAVVSSSEKARLALDAGADAAYLYEDNWVSRVRGADVVYDSVGVTLGASLNAARTGGHVVFYGMAGGDPAPVDPRRLMDESKSLTGGDLWNVLVSREERVRRAGELFELVGDARLDVRISRTFPLEQGAEAHDYLESRKSIGKVLLVP